MNPIKSTAVLLGAIALGATVQASAGGDDHQLTQHVLLISIDGMHALDYENCVNDKPARRWLRWANMA